jgi:diguanylate cyclase (GGDEF)-like protein/PAS domain S-box-containing protein
MRYVSPQIEELTGRSVGEWTVEAWTQAIHEEDRERVLAARRYHTQTGHPYRIEYRLLRSDGRELWVLDEALIEVDKHGRRLHSRGYLQEITERRQLEEQLAHRALHDPLTGLPNRALLLERLTHWGSRRQPGPLAILYIDLDDFKYVNDRLGHAAGDEVLAEVARRLVSSVRDEDTVARMGGDEFAVLLEETDPQGAQLVADRVIKTIAGPPFSIAGTELKVAASVGVATSPRPGRGSPDVVLNHADMAMYEAKGAGKARTAVYAVEMGAGAAMRQRMRSELARALDENEFEVYFQPILDLRDQAIVGAEALVRWRHPLHGIVSPAKFIDTAVETGQIVAIGRVVLEEACRAAAEVRHRTRTPLWITFNLALRELRETDLVQVVQGALHRHSLPAEALVAEITESAFLPDERPTTMRLHALRDIGVRLAIDDFGTGYSSLSYLTRVPADMVKLARPFILALEAGGREATLAQSVIRLCADLGFPTIGEGIETPEQHAIARDLGCPYGQGYLFAKPMPLGQLLRTVETEHTGSAPSALAV